MPRLRLGTPLWLARRRPDAIHFPALSHQTTADVAVVGGGITGATIAWRFADAGLRVVVVDASLVGRGSTAASTALLMQEPDEDYESLADRYGEKRTRRIWELSRMATRDFISVIRRLDISCHLGERDSVYYALTTEASAKLRDEHRRRRSAGRHPHAWKRASRSVRGVRRVPSRRGPARRVDLRAIAGQPDRRRARSRDGRHRSRIGARRPRDHRDRVRHSVLQTAHRSLQDAQHVRRHHATTELV